MLKKNDKISEGGELIIGLLVLAMAFGFAGCKNDANAEWRESELYVLVTGE